MIKDKFNIERVDWQQEGASRLNLYQIFYFTGGHGKIQIDFDVYEVIPPCLFFVSEYQLMTTLGQHSLDGQRIQFANDFFCIKLNRTETFCDAVIFNSTKPPFVNLAARDTNRVDFLLNALQTELQEPSEYQEEIITSQLKTLLLTVSKIKLKQIGQAPFQGLSKTVTDFQNLLESNYKQEHQVQFYADRLFISPKGLNNATKKELGKYASELIKEKLLIEAKRELYQKIKSVKEVAFELGFEDPAYFSRFFKKATNRTPKEFANTLV